MFVLIFAWTSRAQAAHGQFTLGSHLEVHFLSQIGEVFVFLYKSLHRIASE